MTGSRKPVRLSEDFLDLIRNEFPDNPENQVYRDMLYNIALLRDEHLDILELRLLNTAFKELRYALKVFKPYRSIPKAAVFGSARTPARHKNFKLAEQFGRRLAKKGWMIITGGASGIMEAAMRGAGAKNSFGLNILLPFEQGANPVIKGNPKLIYFKYFFTRKLMFLKESEATVLFPGGFGTFDEGFESLTLVQTGKAKPRPIVAVDTRGDSFWRSTLALFRRNMETNGLISRGDLSLVRHCQDAEAAAEEIGGFYSNYHSSRFFKDQYLIRLRKPVSDGVLKELSSEFKDLLTAGGFERLAPPPVSSAKGGPIAVQSKETGGGVADVGQDDIQDKRLERIVFRFDRSNYSRLRQLIDRFNSL